MLKRIIPLFFTCLFISTFAYAQPSESQLKTRVVDYYGDASFIHSIEFQKPKLEKRWVKDSWKYYWSRKYNIKGKTDYTGVYEIIYGGVQYIKNGSNYTFSNILTGGKSGYEGIPNPSVSEINTHLKNTFDPLDFYGNYKMNYLIDAPNTIRLANEPNWKWNGLNEVMCDVVSKYTVLTNNIGGVQDKAGTFRITLTRSEDGISFDPAAGLLKSGKWLPLEKGKESDPKILKSYTISKDELSKTRTFAQKHAIRHAEEFKKSLQVIEMPEFEYTNHLLQFTHELMIEGDKDKITAFCYQMFPSYLFEEWSEIVLNKNGQEKLDKILKDIEYYKLAFCKHPIIKEIGTTYVRFYDRNKKRMNNIGVSWENDRWYVLEMKYFIGQEDLADFEKNKEDNCGENPIYLEDEPFFKTGDKVEIYHGGSWRDAVILKPEMYEGGYSVKYGVSGLTEWKYVSEVRAGETVVEEAAEPFKEFEIGQEIQARYTNVWYPAAVLKVSYDEEKYLVDIPQRNIELWLSSSELDVAANTKNDKDSKKVEDKEETKSSETAPKEQSKAAKKGKSLMGGLKNKVKSTIP